MITHDEALRILDDYLNNGRHGPYTGDEKRMVDHQWTVERDYGWLFTYNSAAFLRSRNKRDRLIGNGHVLVRRSDGAVITFSSAYDDERALTEYEAHPDRFPPEEPWR